MLVFVPASGLLHEQQRRLCITLCRILEQNRNIYVTGAGAIALISPVALLLEAMIDICVVSCCKPRCTCKETSRGMRVQFERRHLFLCDPACTCGVKTKMSRPTATTLLSVAELQAAAAAVVLDSV